MHVMVSLREHCSCAPFQLPPAALPVTIMLPLGGQITSEEQMIFSPEKYLRSVPLLEVIKIYSSEDWSNGGVCESTLYVWLKWVLFRRLFFHQDLSLDLLVLKIWTVSEAIFYPGRIIGVSLYFFQMGKLSSLPDCPGSQNREQLWIIQGPTTWASWFLWLCDIRNLKKQCMFKGTGHGDWNLGPT